ncbi:MAG: glycosyltransferase family 4 protein [Muribaculum sp.]|nr:glycosyltransferase family 4 protein [Muribaculum sp.]
MRLIHVLSSVMWSGVERYALDICRQFRDYGDDVLVVSRDARAVDDVFRHHAIPVLFAPLGGFFSYDAVRVLSGILASSDDSTVVHCHSTRDAFSVLVARSLLSRRNIKIILTRHYVRRGGRTPLHKYVYRNVDEFIFVSEAAKKAFLSSWGARSVMDDDKRLSVLHNSLNIDLQPLVPEPERGAVTAIYLGRLAPYKGLEFIIDALSSLKDIKMRVRLVGTGHPDYVDFLRNKATANGVMHLIDWPRHKENTADFIHASHFGIAPSTAPEAFGLSNLECMSEGRPVIVSNNGAQPEYISDGKEGILVPPSNADILSIEMRRLATDRNLRLRLGANARSRFESQLSWPHFIKNLQQIYIRQIETH